MISSNEFKPWKALLTGHAHPACRAVIIVPVRDEELTLRSTLDALSDQVDLDGRELDPKTFEILLLLNNCRDASAQVANDWHIGHRNLKLHIIERVLRRDRAHVGTARRWLMDTAWQRLRKRNSERRNKVQSAILSTDSDTLVASDWVARNLNALEDGADAVGGVILLRDGELDHLPQGARQAYLLDRKYQSLVAELEDVIDSQPGDPWPRHLEHFGASLACTVDAYANAGGMPAVRPLEDIAFVNALRRQGARIRHDPSVIVYTSARFDGRAEIGLSFQLREWQRLSDHNEDHVVHSVRWLIHRFKRLAQLRSVYKLSDSVLDMGSAHELNRRLSTARRKSPSVEDFLAEIDCDQMISHSFRGERLGKISHVNRGLRAAIKRRKP